MRSRPLLLSFLFIATLTSHPLVLADPLLPNPALQGIARTDAVIVDDFNNDGKDDLAVGQLAGAVVVSVFLGRGDGTFDEKPILTNQSVD